MVVIKPFWEKDPIEYLVLSKFPALAVFATSAIRDRRSSEPEQWLELQAKAEAYRKELQAMPPSERETLVAEARQEELKRYNDYREAEERGRFFNRPEADADFAHWALASFWTLDEATALSLGKDPRVVTWESVLSLTKISPFARMYADRRDLLHRAGVMGQVAKQTAPSVLLAWAERTRFPMPAGLVEAVAALGIQIADWKTLHDQAIARVEQLQAQLYEEHQAHTAALGGHSQYLDKLRNDQGQLIARYDELIAGKDDFIALLEQKVETLTQRIAELEAAPPARAFNKPLITRERDSLLKLVIGMAIKGYSYDPKSGRSPTAKEIAGDLALVGLPMDEDTVRKYLVEAKALLPSDETEHKG